MRRETEILTNLITRESHTGEQEHHREKIAKDLKFFSDDDDGTAKRAAVVMDRESVAVMNQREKEKQRLGLPEK